MNFADDYPEKSKKRTTKTNKDYKNEGSNAETAATPRTENYSDLHPAVPSGKFIKNKENQNDG